MKGFIFGFVTALLIGGWVTLAVVGIISVKVAVLLPVGILIGFIITVLIFTFLFRL